MNPCKSDAGESTNHGDVSSVDTISELSEDLTLQILGQLPFRTVVATSVLSKHWQFIWQKLPNLNLKFDALHHNSETFSDHVIKSLLSHKSFNLESLDLKARLDRCTEVDIIRMLDIACSRKVRNLYLQVQPAERFNYPKTLCNYKTLETLKLKYLVLKDIPSAVCDLKSLRTLDFDLVDFQDEESLPNLLSGCPNLQNLTVKTYPFSEKRLMLNIVVPSLQRLEIYNEWFMKYKMYTPSLKYLRIEKLWSFEFCQTEKLLELEEAYLINVYSDAIENILGYLTSAKSIYSLRLPFSKVMFPTGSIFYRLTYLELKPSCMARWNLLTLMLHSSPKLQYLKLIGNVSKRTGRKGAWNQPQNVPECLLFSLKTFIWEDFEWDEQDNTEVAKFILSKAKHLNRAMFFTNIRNDSRKRAVMAEGLRSIAMASKSCLIN